MAEEHHVRITGWPAEPVQLQHRVHPEEPVPVSVSFQPSPARVVVSTEPGRRMAVDMNMLLRAAEAIPLCIALCEPICAESNYVIGISIFDRPVASITIRGRTRLYNCREEY
jgi:hypothetical protein